MENFRNTNSSKNILKAILRFIVFVGLGVFFIWLSLRSLDKEDIRTMMDSIAVINNPLSWCLLILGAFTLIFADIARAMRTKIQLEALNYRIRFPMAFYSVMVCYLANLALPRLGEILRCSFLQRYENVPFQKSLGTVVTERTVDLILWLGLFFIAIAMNTGMLSNVIIDQDSQLSIGMWMEQKGLSVIGNYFIYLFLAFIIVFILILYWTRRWWQKNKFLMKIRNFFVGIWQGFISIKDLPRPWHYILWTIGMWIAYFFGTYFCFLAFPYLVPAGPGAAFAVLVFSTIAFMVAQGGLGAYPLMTAGVLFMYNIEYTQGLAAGWVGWIVQTVVVIVIGFLSLMLASFYHKPSANKPIE